jgi:hypothetical protein
VLEVAQDPAVPMLHLALRVPHSNTIVPKATAA